LERGTQDGQASLVDRLAVLEDFESKILPALQADLKKGLGTDELREKYAALIQAQMITSALLNPDPKVRVAASKDILDRAHGTAVQRQESTHRLEKLDDTELESLVLSEINSAGLQEEDQDESQTH
jgi:hypothetical protein